MSAPVDMGKWKGLFDWSMGLQKDGGSGAAALDPERRAWLEKALQEGMKDFADRMKEITSSLQVGSEAGDAGAGLAEQEALCDELLDIVESVDHARDLHKVGGLPTLLGLMSSPHPSLRWRAAEIAATCMANNPPVQRWFMEGAALPPLLGLLADPDVRVRTKALLALSALVRHYDPGLEAFRLVGGLEKLLALLGCSSHAGAAAGPAAGSSSDPEQQQQQQRRCERKALALLQYVLAKQPADRLAVAQFGAVAQLRRLLSSPSSDSDMRAAALAVLAELISSPAGWQWVQQHEGASLASQLQGLQAAHLRLGQEDREAGDEEAQLLARLLASLSGPAPPAGAAGGGALQDHIEVDPHADAAGDKTLDVRQRAAPQAQPQAEAAAQQAQAPPAVLAAPLALPKPELR